MKELKYIYIKLEIINGEYTYIVPILMCVRCNNTLLFSEMYAAHLYKKYSYRNGDWWNFFNGEIAVRLIKTEELTYKQYTILKDYI